MRQLFTRNIGWKLLSLVMAIALWIAVAREPELATSLSVPVEFKNMPDDLDFNSSVPDRVQLEIRGSSGRLSRNNLADLAVILDLSDARAGERTYTIRNTSLNLPSGVSFYRATPSQITLRFDRLLARDVPVQPLFVKTPEGYRVQGDSTEPAKVRIRGPEERVKAVDHVMTDPVDLTGVVSEKEFHMHVNVGDPQVRLESPTVITVRVTLERIGSKAVR
ncbi:MAG TPA: CdaR family protein [Bryobacteraceae bacterium]|nr:CdaR family protein [Bryobacteraceae bacterium]